MKEFLLANAPLLKEIQIIRCLAPKRADVYRLLEMGVCEGAKIMVVEKFLHLGAIEIQVNNSRLCITNELASYFAVVFRKNEIRGKSQ